MLVSEFGKTSQQYTGFQVWEVESLPAFFDGSEVLGDIFQDQYHMPAQELNQRRNEIEGTDLDIMTNLLKRVDNKSFFVFTLNDVNHLELVVMQKNKAMNFGIDIQNIRNDCVYVMMMDDKSQLPKT